MLYIKKFLFIFFFTDAKTPDEFCTKYANNNKEVKMELQILSGIFYI